MDHRIMTGRPDSLTLPAASAGKKVNHADKDLELVDKTPAACGRSVTLTAPDKEHARGDRDRAEFILGTEPASQARSGPFRALSRNTTCGARRGVMFPLALWGCNPIHGQPRLLRGPEAHGAGPALAVTRRPGRGPEHEICGGRTCA
jgi:hypothetical protein